MQEKQIVVSAVMCTYGRFTCVERAVNCFLSQTYPHRELIIYNTDQEQPFTDEGCKLGPLGILIVNNGKDMETKLPYPNVGAVRRDALKFASGTHVVTWDDDDIFLPHFMKQAADRILETGLPAFKPARSFFYCGNHLRLVKNTMEASVVASIHKVREYGYHLETGKEGLAWYTAMRDAREIDEHDEHCVPSYCFNWNDGGEMLAPHKQSGDINNPENFENHKRASTDRVGGRPLSIWDVEKMGETYRPYLEFIKAHGGEFPPGLVDKYGL